MEIYQHENETYAALLCDNVNLMARRLREIPPDQWDYLLSATAPSPRMLAMHVWQWLVCDRQHIEQPDLSRHALIPDPPEDTEEFCRAIEEESQRWRELILALTPEQMLEERLQFGHADYIYNVRGFLVHMIRSTLYKHGQFATIYYALGLDGADAYIAPLPNVYYEEQFSAGGDGGE